MFLRLELRLKRLVVQAAASFAAVLLLVTGFAFLTTAAWIGLAYATNHAIAALILGGIWVCLGLLALAIANKAKRPTPKELLPQSNGLALTTAFLSGFSASKR